MPAVPPPSSRSTSPPSSRLSAHLPPHHGGGAALWIVVAVLLAGIVGLLVWKLRGRGEPAGPVATVSAKPPPTPVNVDPPPPPPPEEDAGAADAGAPKVAAAGGVSLCGGKCTGTAGGDLQSAIAKRAGGARGCYERALRVNSMLQGRIVVAVRIDPTGGVCGATITQDEVRSGEVSSCVKGMFAGQKFPAPSGGCVDVNVPLSFQPREGK